MNSPANRPLLAPIVTLETATRQPHPTEAEGYPGVRKVSDPRRAQSPYQVTIYHNNSKTRTYHPTFEKAVAAKQKSERLQKREGSKAFGYSRELHAEAAEAKRIAPEVPLPVLARNHVARLASGKSRKTVREAVDHLVAIKKSLGRSKRHVDDLRSRLTLFADSFEERPIDTIGRNEMVDWLLGLALKPRSIWNYFGALEVLFNHAENRDWLEANPIRRIDRETDLPSKPKGLVGLLTNGQAETVMRRIERDQPTWIPWACIQYFFGIRDAEAERFRGSWIDRKQRRIVMPGWFLEGEEFEPGAKTRDDWVIDDVPPAFWKWYDRYKEHFVRDDDRIAVPTNRPWYKLRDALIAEGVFKSWPSNAFRHGFATNHLSAYRDPGRTSLILRHQNAKRLWASYLAKLVPKPIALRYLSLIPLPK